MKRLVLKITLLISILSMISACSKKEEAPELCISFMYFSFKQTYLRHFQEEDVFLIKGVALDTNKHGRQIKVVEDLKGNFAGKPSIFVWGSTGISCGKAERLDARWDFITQYEKNDTLIMFIKTAHKRFNRDIESPNDYTVLPNYSSVIELSNGYASGYINNWGVDVLWNDLQIELQTRLSSYEQPPMWTEELIPDPFIIAYKGIESSNWTYPISSNENNNYHLIKGLVLNSHSGYGKEIKIITDLKGNFPEKATFTVWGNLNAKIRDFRSLRFDDLNMYNQQDTLIMLLHQTGRTEEIMSGNIEKIGNFATLSRSFSVLKFSNNTVSGHITSTYEEKETMLWSEFQELLNQ